MILVLPTWLDFVICGVIGFWLGKQYVRYQADPKHFWKEFFD